jgi:hypothetical protein
MTLRQGQYVNRTDIVFYVSLMSPYCLVLNVHVTILSCLNVIILSLS